MKGCRHLTLACIIMSMAVTNCLAAAGNEFAQRGRVGMQGNVVESPCAIDLEDRYQVVQLPDESIGQMITNGKSEEVGLSIRLINCNVERVDKTKPAWREFKITFDGAQENEGLFQLGGSSSGVGIQITDEFGEVAIPGVSMSSKPLTNNGDELKYKFRLLGSNKPLVAGNYKASIRFKVDYF